MDKIIEKELGGVIVHKKGYDEHEKHHGISRQLSGKGMQGYIQVYL